jgi:hypothetical protein
VERVNSGVDHPAINLTIDLTTKKIVAVQQFQRRLHQMIRTIAAASRGFHHSFPV